MSDEGLDSIRRRLELQSMYHRLEAAHAAHALRRQARLGTTVVRLWKPIAPILPQAAAAAAALATVLLLRRHRAPRALILAGAIADVLRLLTLLPGASRDQPRDTSAVQTPAQRNGGP